MSSKTLVKSLEYAYIIIENVARKNTADTVLSALRRIGYECVAVFTNSASFGDICKMSKTTGFASSLLPDDDEQVQSMLSQLQQMEMNPADMLVALKTGETWPKCFAKHLEARAHLSSLLEREVPTHEELLATFGNHWSKTLPAREQDILYLHLLEHHRGSTDLPLIWDLTHNITFQQWKEHAYEDTLPCLLRNHRTSKEKAKGWVEKAASEDPIASSLLLNQAAAKLKLLATTLTALEEAERDYKGQLCALSTEIAITLAELRAEAKGETESLALLQLVQRQLGEHYSSISEQLLKEVTSLGFDLVGRDRMGLQSAPGLAEVLSSLRALPEVLSGEPLPTALGLASSEFPDEGLMGSSNGELAACARLQQSRWTAGWCPATSSKEEFLEVDVQRAPHVGRICGIALQGRLPASGHWQQTLGLLQLALGADEEALAFAQPQTFLRPPVRCVHQVAWALHKKRSFKKWQPSEQVRDYENLTKEAKLDFLSRLIEEAHTVKGPVVAGLSDSEDEDVEPLRLTAQDILAGRNCAETNRLLQLLASRALGYGEAPSWTSRWRLQYLVDDDWQWHDESFEGNSSATEVRVVQLPRPLHARKLRIYPLEWRQRPALRLELFVRRLGDRPQGVAAELSLLLAQQDGRYQLSCSNCESWTTKEVLEESDVECQDLWDNASLGYTETLGHPKLLEAIWHCYRPALEDRCRKRSITLPASLCEQQVVNITVCVPVEGIYIAMSQLLGPKDVVIAMTPAYQALTEIARSRSCELWPWTPQWEEGDFWNFRLEDLLGGIHNPHRWKPAWHFLHTA
ncbi:Hypothetical protein SCF082_LOCUS43349 [Durusdinium trenchii]|uniref:F5/8 type C domain-containing protein n=1 Tax=Durusdinium trenchii TaxID=1381693 RepID=A0ABP0QW41_9DINO